MAWHQGVKPYPDFYSSTIFQYKQKCQKMLEKFFKRGWILNTAASSKLKNFEIRSLDYESLKW
jgi:hypothetical protein